MSPAAVREGLDEQLARVSEAWLEHLEAPESELARTRYQRARSAFGHELHAAAVAGEDVELWWLALGLEVEA